MSQHYIRDTHGLFILLVFAFSIYPQKTNYRRVFPGSTMVIEILLNFLFVHSVQTSTKTIPFTTIVAFGDANTDTGNVYNLTGQRWPLVPPYYEGRFTNGLVWIDRLNISNTLNYAYGGATIDNDNLMAGSIGPDRTIVPGIRQQIVTYLTDNNIAASDLSQTLYVIWSDGREYLINSNISVDTVVASLLTTVYDLLAIEIRKLIVVNLPPLQSYPGKNGDPKLSALITAHNNYLLSNISMIQSAYPTVSIEIFDLHAVITKILSDKSVHALNTTDKCWNLSNYTIVSRCSNPDHYVFIDNNHFTRVIHRILADNILQLMIISSSRIVIASKFSIFIMFLILSIVQKF